VKRLLNRIREPSTWAGLAAAAAALGPLFLTQPQVAAVAGIIGGLAVLLGEQGQKKP